MSTHHKENAAEHIDAVEVTERLAWQAPEANPHTHISIDAAALEFLTTGPHQVTALANFGHQLLQEIAAYRPAFKWSSSPAEIVGALIEEAGTPKDSLHYPSTLTPELAEVLGLMNFQTGPIAHIFRAVGSTIKTKCEDEQAFVLDRFIRLAIEHGEGWREAAVKDIQANRDAIVANNAGA